MGQAQKTVKFPIMEISPAVDQFLNTSTATRMQISSVNNKHTNICTLGTLSCLLNKYGLQEQIVAFPIIIRNIQCSCISDHSSVIQIKVEMAIFLVDRTSM